AQRLRQRRRAQHLDVVVGVDVDHYGQHPLAPGVNHFRAAGFVEWLRADGGDMAVADPDIAERPWCAGAVERPAIPNDSVEAHGGCSFQRFAWLAPSMR